MADAAIALSSFSAEAQRTGIDKQLLELIELRASQLNGCAFCVQHHLALAREAGLSEQKIDSLTVWREARVFSGAEIVALEWTEQLTNFEEPAAPDYAWIQMQAHFSDEQIMSLTVAIAAINAWNRIAPGLAFKPVSGL